MNLINQLTRLQSSILCNCNGCFTTLHTLFYKFYTIILLSVHPFQFTDPRKGVTSWRSSAPETTSWLNNAMQRRKFSYTSWLLKRRRTLKMDEISGDFFYNKTIIINSQIIKMVIKYINLTLSKKENSLNTPCFPAAAKDWSLVQEYFIFFWKRKKIFLNY